MTCPFEPFPELFGKRIRLRALADGDCDAIYRLRADKTVAALLCRHAYTTKKQAEERMVFLRDDIVKQKSITWVVSPTGQRDFLGSICLWSFSKEQNKAEIGYELLPEHRGHGIMREAVPLVAQFGFSQMGLSYIDAYPPKDNPRSIHLLEECNFRKTGERSESGQNNNTLHMWVYRLDRPTKTDRQD